MADDFPIESRFALEARVGRGASGDVHRATDRETGRTVAVKRLHAVHDDGLALDRFRREARLLAQIDDPHVVRYVAHGVDEQGRPCLVVEWLEGEDLAHRQRRDRLGVAASLEVVRQAAIGLHALHRAGIVHRDVKPANLYLVPGGFDEGREAGDARDVPCVKLIDLGIARASGESTLTTLGVALGTPFYMSPEQARGEERVTPRADQFSLGVVLFELLAGRRPFAGDDFFSVLAKIVLQDPPRLRDALPGVSADIDELVRRAMSKSPGARFASTLDLAAALAALAPWDGAADPRALAEPSLESGTSRVSAAAMSATFEQRVVTAVFAGFAPAPDDADLRAFAAVAEEHGAVCHPTLGRRMIAIFGGARTTGEEVVRAARAALAAAERIPEIQLAVATGRALAGVTGLTGDLIERAAHDVERDEPYAVRLDDATARLLEDHFVIEGGERQRVLVGVRHAAAAPPHTVGGKPTPFVGRDRELTNLDAAFAECAAEPVARAVIITGPAGIGKSRIRHELLARITGARRGPRPEVLLACGSPLAEASAFGLLAPALRRLAGILDGEPVADQRRKLAARLGRHASAAVVERLGELASVPLADGEPAGDAQARKDAMLTGDLLRDAWIAWLEAESAAQPVVLVLEDLHWGDRASVAFVDAALRALPERPLLVVGLGRPELHDRFPHLFAERAAQELRLGPLTPRATERLVRAALGPAVDAATVERIVARAEGNAFYAEELIRVVAEGAGEALPDTVLGMVQARLDALGVEPKRVLRAASVFGQTFWRGGVAALIGEGREGSEGREGLGETLDRLCAGEAVARRASASFPGEEEYVFRHGLVREAAYAMITDVDRPVAHRLAGAWLERAGEVDPAILAAHYARGAELERAAHFHRRAAEKALGGNDFAGAILHAEGCVACGARDEERGRARLIQAEAHRWRAELGPAAIAGAEAAELLPRGSALWFHAVRETIAANGRLGHFSLVGLWADEAIGCEAGPEAAGARLAALAPAAGQLIYAGELEAAARLVAHIDLLVAGAREVDPRVSARVSQLHALRADHDRDLEAARAHQEAALASFERAGDRRGACLTLANLGFLYAALGDLAEAEDALRRAHASAQRMGLSTIAPLALHNLGGVLASLGRLDEARAVEEEAVRAFERAGDPRLEGASRVYLARILLASGDPARAEAEARLVVEASASPAPLRAGALAALTQALIAQGRAAEALTAAAEAARALESLGAVEDFEILIGLAHAEALEALGDRGAARSAIACACARVLARAARLHEPTRTRFLAIVPDNARCFALARAWGVETG